MAGGGEKQRVAIIGAGLSGSLMAIYLGRQGFAVDVYERRADPRDEKVGEGNRSINLGLSQRGIKALSEVGLLGDIMKHATPMRGRMIHRPSGPPVFQAYGVTEDQILHSILRHDLNVSLIEAALSHPATSFHFLTRLEKIDRDTGAATLVDETDGRRWEVEADVVIGADGAFSKVRQQIQHGVPADYHQEFLDWGYKELTIPAAPDGLPRAEPTALHVWPGDEGLIVAHPNANNSLTATLFLPLEGGTSFASISSEAAVLEYFRTNFPDAIDLMPDLVDEFTENPTGTMVCIRTDRWHHGGKVVLIGDACHAVYPFYGQGMNSSFEDCMVLARCIEEHRGDWASAFSRYQRLRKPNTDVLADLSKQNFIELRDRLRSPYHLFRKKLDTILNRFLQDSWTPLYTMVSHTTMPYTEALQRSRRQDALVKWTTIGLGVGATTAGWLIGRRKTR